MKKTLLLLAVVAFVISCKDSGNKKSYRPKSIGPVNSLIIVMENDLWEGAVGNKVRQHFAEAVFGLPWDEPRFTINQIPASVFSGTITNSRSVLIVQKDTSNIAEIKTNLYSRPQRVAIVKAQTEEQLIANLDAKAKEMVDSYKSLELQEMQTRFKHSLSKEKALENKFGISMTIPSVYKVGRDEDNFVWIDREIPKGTMNIIAYTMPEDSFETDSTFVRDIVKMRDSIGKLYVPGPRVADTYMITEKAFAPHVYPAEFAGIKAAEVRGIWDELEAILKTLRLNAPKNK